MNVFKETKEVARPTLDKAVLGFLADVLYIKGFINFEEFEAIQEVRNTHDLQTVADKMLGGEYSGYKKGEGYVTTADGR